MSLEWAASGVRVNVVAPGYIYSKSADANYGEFRMFDSEGKKVPAKRAGTTEEVSAAVCYLLSPGAQYISGATLTVDGGVVNYFHQQYQIPGNKSYTNIIYNVYSFSSIADHNNLPPYKW